MTDLNQKINVVITGDDSKFRAAAKSSEKATSDLEKKASSDLKKIASNFAGMFSDKGKDSGIAKFAGEVTDGTSALSSFAGPAAAAAGVITGITTAAVGAGVALFNMAKEASDYGSELADAQAKTGLTAESLSALRYQANLSGSDFGAVSGAIGKFSKLVGEAAKGSDEAKGKLKALGIDPQEAVKDLDGALGKAFKTINDAKPGVAQMTAATDAFGKSGADLVPTITGMNGDFAALKKRATELGIVLSEEDVKAADDFGDTLDTLSMQAKATSAKFALQFAPEITEAMNGISKSLAQNQDKWREWGKTIGDTMRGIREFSKSEAGQTTKYWLEAYLKLQFYAPLWIADKFRQSGAESKQAEYNNLLANSENAIPGLADPTSTTLAAPSIKTLNTGAADNEDYLSRAAKIAKAGKSKKDSLTEAQKVTWNSAQIAEFVRGQGWKTDESNGSGFAKKGHNDGSLHGSNRAFDAGLGATNPNKTVAEVVEMMANAIKSGLRAVDERVRPKPGAKWSAPHVHLEENDTKASFFNPNLDYGGKLEYLKALDAERLKGKSKSLADALGSDDKKQIGDGARALADYDKQVQLLGASTESARVEFEILKGTYNDLTPKQKEQLLAFVATKEAFELQAKASEEYISHLDSLGTKYDEITGVQKTATQELEKYLSTAKSAGVVIGIYTEQTARYKAAVIDAATAKEKLTEAEKEYQATIQKTTEEAAGYQLTDPGTPEGAFKKPQAKQKVGIDDYWGAYGDSKAKADEMGVLFDPDSLAVQMDALTEFKDVAIDAFGGIADGLGQVLENWIMTGEMSGQAIAKMTASVIAGVAAQAGVKAIFELAEGLAALANPFTAWEAPLHFAAAKTYGLVALGATAIGLGIGAAGGLGSKKDKSSGSSGDKSPSDYLKENSSDDRRMDFLRQSQNDQARNQIEYKRELSMISESIDNLNGKIGSMRPGDVLTSGIKQNPGLVSSTTMSELNKNSTKATQFGRVLRMN